MCLVALLNIASNQDVWLTAFLLKGTGTLAKSMSAFCGSKDFEGIVCFSSDVMGEDRFAITDKWHESDGVLQNQERSYAV